MRELRTFVVAPVVADGGGEPGWIVTEGGRVIGRHASQSHAWRAAAAAAYDASILCDEPSLVLLRDADGRVMRHMELGVAPAVELAPPAQES